MSNPIDISKMKGLFTPILTPVDAEERIDEAKLRRQVDFVIEHGVDGILAFGSNSEFYMFDDDEMIEGTRIILDQVAGRVPVIFGVGHISTRACIALAKRAAELPIDGIAVLQPRCSSSPRTRRSCTTTPRLRTPCPIPSSSSTTIPAAAVMCCRTT